MQLIRDLVQLYILCVFARILLSWFPISPDSPLSGIFRFLYAITEPLLGPVRRLLPPIGMGGMGLDLSPIIVIVGLEIVSNALLR